MKALEALEDVINVQTHTYTPIHAYTHTHTHPPTHTHKIFKKIYDKKI